MQKNILRRKYVFSCILIVIVVWLYLYIRVETEFSNYLTKCHDKIKVPSSSQDIDRKYFILQWTSPYTEPFVFMKKGQSAFQNCKFKNCYVTSEKKYFEDTRQFDVIAFHGAEIISPYNLNKPDVRSPKQKYAFVNVESAHNYPICGDEFDNFFNWTWTYKLNSDVVLGYIHIWNERNEIIGPHENMHWIDAKDMDPISDEMKMELSSKNKTALWVVSNCSSKSKREELVEDIKKAMVKYNLTVETLGECGENYFDKSFEELSKDYYFYFAFENSFSEDYVTEKILHALNNNMIPVVYGTANYTRFMPPGIYLDATELKPEELVYKMYEIINEKEKLYEYFKWKKYYHYNGHTEKSDSNAYCKLCRLLNNEEEMETTTVYKDFKKWWTPSNLC